MSSNSSSSGVSSWRSGNPSSAAARRLHNHDGGSGSSSTASVGVGSPSSQSSPAQHCETICHMLKMLSCTDGQRALLAITSSPESCQSLRRAGCIPLLIQIMHPGSTTQLESHPSAETKSRASRALKNIVHFNPDEKMKRKELRVLRLLESIRTFASLPTNTNGSSSSSSSSTQATPPHVHIHPTTSCTALMKLSFDDLHRNTMCTLGAIHALADLIIADHKLHGAQLSDSDPVPNDSNQPETATTTETTTTTPTPAAINTADCITIRRYSCMSLTNLTFGDGVNKALLCSMNEFLTCLVAQLGFQRNEDVVQVTASVLRNLSWRADSNAKTELQNSHAVYGLMSAALTAKKESTLKATLSALWNLSAHSSVNKAAICSTPNALQFLVSLLRPDQHHHHHNHNPNGHHPHQPGQIPIPRTYDKSMTIVENAGGILRNVSSHIAGVSQYRQILREAHCFEILLGQLRSSSLTVVSNSCGTLWNLSGHDEEKRRLLELNAMPMLKSLRYSKDDRISQAATATLQNLLVYFEQQQQQQQKQAQLHQLQQQQSQSQSQELNSEKSEPSSSSQYEDARDHFVDEEEEEEDEEQPLDLTITSCKSSPVRKLNPPPFLNPPIYNGSVSATRSCPDIQVKNQHQGQGQPQIQSQSQSQPPRPIQIQGQQQQQRHPAQKLEGSSDETFNYSLNYDEEEEDDDEEELEEEEEAEKHEQNKDSVKTFCEEGTPRFSNDGSMVDLTICHQLSSTTNDTCIQFQVEDTPAVFSRTSSLSSIDNGENPNTSSSGGANVHPKCGKKPGVQNILNTKNSPLASTSCQASPIPVVSVLPLQIATPAPIPIPNPSSAPMTPGSSISHGQNHSHNQGQGKRVMFSAEETPLMFSRCSSVGSLESCGDLTGRCESDCVSEFSRRTSEVVSPSELPDSPRDCKTIPNHNHHHNHNHNHSHSHPFKIPETNETEPEPDPEIEIDKDLKKKTAIATDELKVFAMEGTPFLISTATSLSDIVGEFVENQNQSPPNPGVQNQHQNQAAKLPALPTVITTEEIRTVPHHQSQPLQKVEEKKVQEGQMRSPAKISMQQGQSSKMPKVDKNSEGQEPNGKIAGDLGQQDDDEDEDDPIYSDVQLLQKCIRAGRQGLASSMKSNNNCNNNHVNLVPNNNNPEKVKKSDPEPALTIEDSDEVEVDLSHLIQRGRAKLMNLTGTPTKIPVAINSSIKVRSNGHNHNISPFKSKPGNEVNVDLITQKMSTTSIANSSNDGELDSNATTNTNASAITAYVRGGQGQGHSPGHGQGQSHDFDSLQNPSGDTTMVSTTPMTMTTSESLSVSADEMTWTDDTPDFSSMSVPSMSISKAMRKVVRAEEIDTLSDIEQPTLLDSNSLISSSTHNNNGAHNNAHSHSHNHNNRQPLSLLQKQKHQQLLQSSITCSSSQVSNLMNQKPPAEFFDLELENSMISVASIKSEIFDDASLLMSMSCSSSAQNQNQNQGQPLTSFSSMSNHVPTIVNSNHSNNIVNNNNNASNSTSQVTNNNNNTPSTSGSSANANVNNSNNSPSKYDTYVIKRIESASMSSPNSHSSANNSPKDRRRTDPDRYLTRTIEKFDLSKAKLKVASEGVNTRTIEKTKVKPPVPPRNFSISPSPSSSTVHNNNHNNNGNNNIMTTFTSSNNENTSPVEQIIRMSDNDNTKNMSSNFTNNANVNNTTTLPRNVKLMESQGHGGDEHNSGGGNSMKRINMMSGSNSTGGLSSVLNNGIPPPVNSISTPVITIAQHQQQQMPQILSGIPKDQKHGNKFMNFGGRLGNLFRRSFIHSSKETMSDNPNPSTSSSNSSTAVGGEAGAAGASGGTEKEKKSTGGGVAGIWGRKREKQRLKEKEKALVSPFNYKPPQNATASAVTATTSQEGNNQDSEKNSKVKEKVKGQVHDVVLVENVVGFTRVPNNIGIEEELREDNKNRSYSSKVNVKTKSGSSAAKNEGERSSSVDSSGHLISQSPRSSQRQGQNPNPNQKSSSSKVTSV